LEPFDCVGLIVDPIERKRIEDQIKDAKIALVLIEQEMQKVTDNMQQLGQEAREYQKNHVRPPSLPFSWCFYADYDCIKAALTARRNAVTVADAKHRSLQHKIGKF
jgi:hypothetical protein